MLKYLVILFLLVNLVSTAAVDGFSQEGQHHDTQGEQEHEERQDSILRELQSEVGSIKQNISVLLEKVNNRHHHRQNENYYRRGHHHHHHHHSHDNSRHDNHHHHRHHHGHHEHEDCDNEHHSDHRHHDHNDPDHDRHDDHDDHDEHHHNQHEHNHDHHDDGRHHPQRHDGRDDHHHCRNDDHDDHHHRRHEDHDDHRHHEDTDHDHDNYNDPRQDGGQGRYEDEDDENQGRYPDENENEYTHAHCEMHRAPELDELDPRRIHGEIHMKQSARGGPVDVLVNLTGFDVTSQERNHAFHIHVYGDLSDGCKNLGRSYDNADEDKTDIEHFGTTGNFGNITRDDTGSVVTSFTNNRITVKGRHSVFGRSIVVHALPYTDGSKGSAGIHIACCVIGRSE